jgi:hypothetical protein
VNNDPVNWIDPWGLNASDKKSSFWETVKDIGGKIIAAPVTAVGLLAGSALVGLSKITGNGGSISIQNNAITFTTGLNLNGSITLGNAIIHAGGDAEDWNADKQVWAYDNTGKVNLGKHEEAHTYQYQKYGVLTPALIVGSAIMNGGLKESSSHDFMGKSEYEQAADDYAAGLITKEDL